MIDLILLQKELIIMRDFPLALKMIKKAKEAGASAVKFQIILKVITVIKKVMSTNGFPEQQNENDDPTKKKVDGFTQTQG